MSFLLDSDICSAHLKGNAKVNSRVIQYGVTSVNESHRADRQLSPTRPRSSTTCSTPNARR